MEIHDYINSKDFINQILEHGIRKLKENATENKINKNIFKQILAEQQEKPKEETYEKNFLTTDEQQFKAALSMIDSIKKNKTCKRCGKPIQYGQYCDECGSIPRSIY